jgi:signal transduction histidine kinase
MSRVGARIRRGLRPFGSLRLRVALGAAAVIGVVLLVTSVVVVHAVRSSIRNQIRAEGKALTYGIARRVDDTAKGPVAGFWLNPGGPLPSPLQLPAASSPAVVQVLDAGGHVIASSLAPPAGTGGVAVLSRPGLLRVTSPVTTPHGRLQVVAELPLTRVQQSVDAVVDVLRIAIPFLVVAAGFMAWLLVGRALRPVETIRAEVDEISHTTITRRVPEPAGHDEIGRLAHTMNDMLARLDGAARRQREFISNASHELRSPLASAHTTLEAASRAPDDANWQQVAADALAEQERISAIIDELLELARFDEASPDAQHQPVALDDIVFTEASRILNKPVDLGKVSGGRTVGDPTQLTRLVRNLLLNAGRHADRHIAVTLSEDEDTLHLIVDDDGPGIPEPQRDRVFERFVRLDDARTRDDGGVGLGLALVASITQHHGGRVSIDDSPLGGARFDVTLPRAPAPETAGSLGTDRRSY